MSFQIKPATKSDAIPIILLSGGPFSGKTLSALKLARGVVGPKGSIVLIDSEGGRGNTYADQIENGYEVISITDPFSPERYIEAIATAERENYDAIIVDSVSHEWDGVGGVLDIHSMIVEKLQAANKKAGINAWAKPKQDHNKFIQKLITSPSFIVATCRSKYKSKQVGNNVVKDDELSLIQSEDFGFEMTVHLELNPNNVVTVKKCDDYELKDIFKDGIIISEETGRQVTQWSNSHKDTTEAPEALSRAKKQAYHGKKAFVAWAKDLNEVEKAVLKPYKAQLEGICGESDAIVVKIKACNTKDDLNKLWNNDVEEEFKEPLIEVFNERLMGVE